MAKSIADITSQFSDFTKHYRKYLELQGKEEYDPEQFAWFRPDEVKDTTDLDKISAPYKTDELEEMARKLTESADTETVNAGDYALVMLQHDAILSANRSFAARHKSKLRHFAHAAGIQERLGNLTLFCSRALSPNDRGVKPLGVMLLGVSGGGKSAFCKRLGYSVHRPTLVLDIGALMGSLVGQTEAALRKALKQIDAMSPCIVMIDEIEKAVSSGGNDGGVSARILGTLLSWLNDRDSDSFVVCTANDISKLPPEFTRAERFDGIFFVDLPDKEAREQIWKIYLHEYDLPDGKRPDDTDWTGAEIKACCRLAKLLELSLREAAENVVPVAGTAAESIQSLRTWASGRCLDAARPGIYRYREMGQTTAQNGSRRNLSGGNRKNLLTDTLAPGV